jgi:DNA-binding GntR family transcriptional regulator
MREDAERFAWHIGEWCKPLTESHAQIFEAFRSGDVTRVRAAIDEARRLAGGGGE